MELKTNYDDVKDRYHNAVLEILQKKNRGSSRHKDDVLDTFNWTFDFCIAIQPYTLSEVVNQASTGVRPKQQPIRERIDSCILVCKKGRAHWRAVLPEVPQEVLHRFSSSQTLPYARL